VASSNERVVTKIAEATRVLGRPDQVVSGIINQMQSVTKMQIQMMHHTMEARHRLLAAEFIREPN
jgi:hypothetical protein